MPAPDGLAGDRKALGELCVGKIVIGHDGHPLFSDAFQCDQIFRAENWRIISEIIPHLTRLLY